MLLAKKKPLLKDRTENVFRRLFKLPLLVIYVVIATFLKLQLQKLVILRLVNVCT